MPHVYWVLDLDPLDPLEEQEVLLAFEPSLQPLVLSQIYLFRFLNSRLSLSVVV